MRKELKNIMQKTARVYLELSRGECFECVVLIFQEKFSGDHCSYVPVRISLRLINVIGT